jgi:mannose/fructose/N-acetylgalactosamine-specific phosphotransferase system component IID
MEKVNERSTPLRYFAAFIGTLIIVLGILDVVSTNLVLQAGGVEMNPIVALWMKYLDHWWHLPKLLIHLLAAYLVYYLLSSRFTAAVALVVVFVYGIIVHHNFSLISSL